MDDSTLKRLACFIKGTKTEIQLEPKFSKAIKQYTAVVGSDCTGLTVTAVCNEGDAFSQVQKTGADGTITLKEGSNMVEVKVDAVDKSFSIYQVEVYRPSASDASLKGIKTSTGILFPGFHHTEKSYTLTIDAHITSLTLSPFALNPKSKITTKCSATGVTGNSDVSVPLLLGDTQVVIEVVSGDEKSTELYNVIIRRCKPGYKSYSSVTQTSSNKNQICSVCNLIVFRPRIFSPSSSCTHSFCLTCLELFGKTGKREEKFAGTDEVKSVTYLDCPICPQSDNSKSTDSGCCWKNDPVKCPDQEMEKLFARTPAQCPFVEFGCKSAEKLNMETLGPHVSSCQFSPKECIECRKLASQESLVKDGDQWKHKDGACTTKCECGRRFITSERIYHDSMCSSKSSTSSLSTFSSSEVKIKPWESALVDKKKYPGDPQSLVSKVNKELLPKYLNALDAAIKSTRESFGTNTSISVDRSGLDEITRMYAAAVSNYLDSKPLKAGGGNAQEESSYHLNLGLMMEETLRVKEAFPSPTELNTKKKSTCKKEELVDDGFYQDEVDGLLAMLGVSKTASEESKVMAIEQEYHRLLDIGDSDKAAEVQGLHEWKIKALFNSGKAGIAQSNTSFSSGYNNVLEKYKDAVEADPSSPDALFHYGRLLLIFNKFEEATSCLRRVVGMKPTSNSARILLGISLLSSEIPPAAGVSPIKEGLSYVEGEIKKFSIIQWCNYKANASGNPDSLVKLSDTSATPSLMVDQFFDLMNIQGFCRAWFAASRGHFLCSNNVSAREVLLDLLYLLPDEMRCYNRKTTIHLLYATTICHAKLELLKIPYDPSKSSQMTVLLMENITENLLRVTDAATSSSADLDQPENKSRVIELKKRVIEVLVAKAPQNTNVLSALGTNQLEEFDASSEDKERIPILMDAEKSFNSAIVSEGTASLLGSSSPPVGISSQQWYKSFLFKEKLLKEYAEKVKNESSTATTTASTMKPAATTGGGKPAAGGAKATTAAVKSGPDSSAKKVPSPAAATATAFETAVKPKAPASQPNKPSVVKPVAVTSPKKDVAAATEKKVTSTAPTPVGAARPASSKPSPTTTKPAKAPTGAASKSATSSTTATKNFEVKEMSASKTKAPTVTAVQTEATTTTSPLVAAVVQKSFSARIGLARVLHRKFLILESPNLNKNEKGEAMITDSKADLVSGLTKWYKEAMLLQPRFHDCYIELGQILEKYESLAAAADVFASFPFLVNQSNQDDLFLHGEVTRTFMKEKRYKDPRLLKSLIAEGQAMGIKTLQKYIDILDGAAATTVLIDLYCGVNKRPKDDPELNAFFKAKFWI